MLGSSLRPMEETWKPAGLISLDFVFMLQGIPESGEATPAQQRRADSNGEGRARAGRDLPVLSRLASSWARPGSLLNSPVLYQVKF